MAQPETWQVLTSLNLRFYRRSRLRGACYASSPFSPWTSEGMLRVDCAVLSAALAEQWSLKGKPGPKCVRVRDFLASKTAFERLNLCVIGLRDVKKHQNDPQPTNKSPVFPCPPSSCSGFLLASPRRGLHFNTSADSRGSSWRGCHAAGDAK